jgi:ABC-type lipoprotein export system ATPase subunit/GNAT superfamily N-acetyltransferase
MNYLEDIKKKYDIKDYKEPDINIPDFSDKHGIILVVGSSGSGKSTILRENGLSCDISTLFDTSKSIIENFSDPKKAETLLLAVGLRSIPTWFRPITQVSNGERHRAETALALDRNINAIDEFTSVVDRNTAKSLSYTIRKYYDKISNETGLDKIILASCHHDIIEWLQPDYIYDTDKQDFIKKDLLRRPDIELEIISSSIEDWVYFKKHHYLTSEMSKSVHCYTAYWNGQRVAFLSTIHGTGYPITTYWRESRLVVLPEFQGLGIGKTLANAIAEEYVKRGHKYFSRTAHPAMGEYRNNSILWKATSNNMKARKDYVINGKPDTHNGRFKAETRLRDAYRITYSHEYIGDAETQRLFKENDVMKKRTEELDEW